MTSNQLGDANELAGMTPVALAAIATLTGEQPHPSRHDGITYAVSKSWVVWRHKDDWKAVHRPTCTLQISWCVSDLLGKDMRYNCPWKQYEMIGLRPADLQALRESRGYTMTDLAVRMGYHPSNRINVSQVLSGKRVPSTEFVQRAIAAFGRIGGE